MNGDRLTQNKILSIAEIPKLEPSRHLQDNFQTPSRHLSDTFQTPSRYYLDTTQTPSDNFHTPKDHCSQYLSNPSGGWVGRLRSLCVGLHVHNHATSWPNLQVETCMLELNLS